MLKDIKIFLLLIVNCALFISNCFGQSITWQRVLNNNYGAIRKVEQTFDSGFIAVGADRINSEYKIYLTKLDYMGITLWTKIIGVGFTEGFWIEETLDRGFIIGGTTDSGMFSDYAYLVKTDSHGNIQWVKSYSNSNLDQCYCVKQTPDNGYILSCRTTPSFADKVWFIKTDSIGNIIWQRIYGNGITGQSIHEITLFNSGYVAVGTLGSTSSADAYLMRLNSNGDTIWTKSYGGTRTDLANSIDLIGNQGFILGGISHSFNTNNIQESYLLRLDTNGTMLWQKTYKSNQFDACKTVRYEAGTGLVLGGYSDSLIVNNLIAKIRIVDLNGIVLRENSYLPEGFDESVFESLEPAMDNGYISGGYVGGNMYIVKSDSLLNSNPIGINIHHESILETFKLYQNYPNPFNSNTIIKIALKEKAKVNVTIFDINGRIVKELMNTDLGFGLYYINFNAESAGLSSGIYFCTLRINNVIIPFAIKKMVFLK